MICSTSSQALAAKKKSVFNHGDFRDPKQIHKDMLAAKEDFEQLITENKEVIKEKTNHE